VEKMPLSRHIKTIFYISILLLTIIPSIYHIHAANSIYRVVVVELHMAIDEGAVAFVKRSIDLCRDCFLVLSISSNGGYLTSTQRIVGMVIENNVRCVSWIPPGSQAYSAAAIVAFSCSGLYMGSGSVIGAVKPYPSDEKSIEAVKSLLTSLMIRIYGDVDWVRQLARDMVDGAKALDYSSAISMGLAKKAENLDDIISDFLSGQGIDVVVLHPNLWEKIVSVLSNPVIYSAMLVAGTLLIVVEIFTTGFQGYGVAGAILILLALYSMSLIPPDIISIALLLSGVALLAVEIFTPGFGAFGISGIALTAIGMALTIFSTPLETMTPTIYIFAIGLSSLAGFMAFIGFKGAEAMRIKRESIQEVLIGSIGIAKTDIGEINPGVVYVANEDWTAYSVKGVVKQGSRVRVVRVKGLKLYVEEYHEV
jgi:membrane-bound serine protease (ClpP class)